MLFTEFEQAERTDTIELRDGRKHTVTMTNWHWQTLDWITKDRGHPMYVVIDIAEEAYPDLAKEGLDFSRVLEAVISQFSISWHTGRYKEYMTNDDDIG